MVSREQRTAEGRLWLGAILDEFTTDCLRPECQLITFRPDNWRATLEACRPDALFVESAWRGNDATATRQWVDLITTDSDTPASLRSRVDGLRALLPPAAKS